MDASHNVPAWIRPQTSRFADLRRLANRRNLYIFGILAALLIAGGLVLSTLSIDFVAVPSPRSVRSDVTILFDNDLRGTQSSNQDAAFVLSIPKTYAEAAHACFDVGEDIFNANKSSTSFLGYLEYADDRTEDILYWVKGKSGSRCATITAKGQMQYVRCSEQHRTLCTQSAPQSTAKKTNRGQRYKIDVHTGQQVIRGYRDRRSFRFHGIRYAPQPKRFEHSTVYRGTGHSVAFDPPPVCLQAGRTGSEDCLFLNIFTPFLPESGESSTMLRPVMFYIHGGALQNGYSATMAYDGGNIASRGDVLLVTVNYRVSTLGFFALDDGVTTGNWGLGDQITALDWVREHIEDFGGDPERITIVGQSAGAASVRALLGAPRARGKFSAAIMQSNLGGYGWAQSFSQYPDLDSELQATSTLILQQTDCAQGSKEQQLQCLRSLPAETLQNLATRSGHIIVDNELVPTAAISLQDSSHTAPVPILMGTTLDDAVVFIPDVVPGVDTDLAEVLTRWGFDGYALVASGLFPLELNKSDFASVEPHVFDFGNMYHSAARVATDAMFRCTGHATAASLVRNDISPALWYYELGRTYIVWQGRPQCFAPMTSEYPLGNPSLPHYKCHSGDVAYAMGNVAFVGVPDRDGQDVLFSQTMLDQWTAFARTGNPNPDPEFLKARGYVDSLRTLNQAGRWRPVGENGKDDLTMRLLQPESVEVEFSERRQCDVLGYGLDYFEKL